MWRSDLAPDEGHMEKDRPVFPHGQARLVALATLLVLVAPVCAQDGAKVEIAPMLGHPRFDASLQLWSTTMSMAFEKEAAQPIAGLFMAIEYALDLSEEARRKIPVSLRKDTTPRIYAPIGTLHGQFHAASTPPDTATDCDRLASHPNDPLRVVSDGIPIDKLDADAALAACSQAISNAPSEGRYYFNRARALAKIADAARKAKNEPRMSSVYEALAKIADAARKANEARISSLYEAELADFKAAMERGYPMAFNNLALAYFSAREWRRIPTRRPT